MVSAAIQLIDVAVTLDNIGFVVIGRNEGQRLFRCLSSIGGNHQVVYVDSGSTDDSVATAKELGSYVVKLDLAQPFTAARARNEGFRALKSLAADFQFVQFVDGDCELQTGWPDAALAFLKTREDVALVCGRRRERQPEASVYNQLCDIEWDTAIGETKACGGDALARVAALESANGFLPSLIAGEEPELCVRLRESGWKIWRLNFEMTLHDAAITRFGQWWARGIRTGHAYIEVYWMHRASSCGIYLKETVRAVVWGGLIPLFLILGVVVYPLAAAGIVVYPVQVARIALRRGLFAPHSWRFAAFTVISKFAEFFGVLKFVWSCLRGRTVELIEYKHAG
jgi:glycosyltransferase involved in cell wall biosynthesis